MPRIELLWRIDGGGRERECWRETEMMEQTGNEAGLAGWRRIRERWSDGWNLVEPELESDAVD